MKSIRSGKIILLGILLLTVVAALFVVPRFYGDRYLPWRLGLDLVGGSVLVYEVDLEGIPADDHAATVEGLKDVIETRINKYGVAEPRVTVAEKNGSYQLLVELAGVKDLKDAVREIGETPALDFREGIELQIEGSEGTEPILIWNRTELTGRHITRASLAFDQVTNNEPVVNLEFDEEGTRLFEEITGRNIGKPVCIYIDNSPYSCPAPQEKITGGKAVISGGDQGFTLEEARSLVERLNAGALSAPVTLVNQRTVSASAAGDALYAVLYAGLIGTLLVMLFMLIYYRSLGIFASVALFIYILLTLAAFKILPNFTMTLSGIAGFILSIGMAVDANILIFERTQEELRRGLSKAAALEEGFRRAWTSIRDSNITTIIGAVILYYFTTSFVKGFALTLGVGVLTSMFTAIFVTKQMLRVFMRK